MFTFPKTTIDRFYSEFWPTVKGQLRVGQAFHQYMKLDKLSADKVPIDGPLSKEKKWLDRLYQADGYDAHLLIEACADYDN